MASINQDRNEALRELLKDAVEVQLAAFKAGISFWRQWVEQTSEFVKSASTSLRTLNTEDHPPKEVLLEMVDAGRASIRSMTELPRDTAVRFIEALDEFAEKKRGRAVARGPRAKATAATAPEKDPATTKAKGGKRKSRPRRPSRVKA